MRVNPFSLLVVRCPFKPYAESNSNLSDQESFSFPAQEFAWYLSDGLGSEGQSGIGSIGSMPYADEVLALIPTLDVRLIEVKMPLVSDKKLQSILPGLMEEYLLQGVHHVHMQMLPPMPGAQALQRTVAIIDRLWFVWLNQQLSDLLAPRVRLLPDCYMLPTPQAEKIESTMPLQTSVAYEYRGQNLVWTVRQSDQIGASWVESALDMHAKSEESIVHPPTFMHAEKIRLMDWVCLMEGASQFIEQLRYAGINLLPSTFQLKSRSGRVVSADNISQFSGLNAWKDLKVWRSSMQWLTYGFATIFIGMSLHLSWLVLTDWRWNQMMQLWAIPYLSTTSVADLAGSKDHHPVLSLLIQKDIENRRMHGLVSNADFLQMSSELQRLNALFGEGMIESLEYDGYSLKFELKPDTLELRKVSSAELVTKANALSLGLIALKENQFQLLPYAGLGGNK